MLGALALLAVGGGACFQLESARTARAVDAARSTVEEALQLDLARPGSAEGRLGTSPSTYFWARRWDLKARLLPPFETEADARTALNGVLVEVAWRELEPPPGARAGAQTRVLGISELLQTAATPGQPELWNPGFWVDLVSGPCLVSCRVLDTTPAAAGRRLTLIGCHDLCGCEAMASLVPGLGALTCYLVAALSCLGMAWSFAKRRRDPGGLTA